LLPLEGKTNTVHTTVAIIGGGLAGLYAGKLLHAAQIDFKLTEARDRLGGRILSTDETHAPSEDGFDLGPSWFWPAMQPELAALVRDLGLATFPQHNDGDVIFERMSRETPWRYRATYQEPQSMRLVGGAGRLITALAKHLPPESILIGTSVKHMALGASNVSLTIAKADGSADTLLAYQVIAALPPRLLADISLSPAVDPATSQRWSETPTWMAPHAKFFAVYDLPFWRDAGLSGTAQSFVGPLGEIHDATTASGKAALFGFLGDDARVRAAFGEAALRNACLAQLARLYGPQALHPRATLFKDWAADPFTATAGDRNGGTHPVPSSSPWVTGAWQERLSLGGSETSAAEPGYMAGAVSAAGRAATEVMQGLRVHSEKSNP
jgi:monoamine oxidase